MRHLLKVCPHILRPDLTPALGKGVGLLCIVHACTHPQPHGQLVTTSGSGGDQPLYLGGKCSNCGYAVVIHMFWVTDSKIMPHLHFTPGRYMLPTSNACMAQVQVHQVQRNCCSNSCWKGWWRAVQLKCRPRLLCKQPGCWPQAPCMPPLGQTKHHAAGCRKAKMYPPYDSSLMPWHVVSTSP